MADWQTTTLGELCSLGAAQIQTGPFGSQLHAHEYVEDGVPVVPTEAIGNRRIDHTVLPKISNEKAATLQRHQLRPGDILFARRGVQATGRSAIVREHEAGFVCGTGAIRLRLQFPASPVLPDFLSLVLSDSASIEWFKFHAIGATMPNLNEGIIKAFRFPAPPLAEQVAITSILGGIDDKIDLNRRMNETLEAMARAIFKDWFVDFGPTRAKMEGRLPYLAPDLWALFPNQFDEEGKPEGWAQGSLHQYATLNAETWTKSAYPEAVEYVDLSGTKWGYVQETSLLSRLEAPSRAQRILRAGDTIVGTVRPGNGSFALIGRDGFTGSTGFAALRPKSHFYRELVYLAATAKDNIERLAHLADGGAYPAVRPDIVANTEVWHVNEATLRAFHHLTATLLDQLLYHDKESRTLAATRDLLLPKLISGEVRVSDAEHLLGAVA